MLATLVFLASPVPGYSIGCLLRVEDAATLRLQSQTTAAREPGTGELTLSVSSTRFLLLLSLSRTLRSLLFLVDVVFVYYLVSAIS